LKVYFDLDEIWTLFTGHYIVKNFHNIST